MPLFRVRQLGSVRSQNSLSSSLRIQGAEMGTDTQDSRQSMKVKGDSFGTPCEKKDAKSANSEENQISDYECHLLSELEHLKITIMELRAQLQEKSRALTEVQKKRKDENLRYHQMVEEMTNEHNYTREELNRANLVLERMNDKLYKAEMEAKEKLDTLKEKMEREKAELLEEKEAEIAWRKEKMNALKKQICETFTGNSLVRQKQLDEMSKELDKVNIEADNLRLKLQTSKTSSVKKTNDISCLECKNKQMTLKLKDIEIDQLKARLKFEGIESSGDEFVKMPQKGRLTATEKRRIVVGLAEGRTLLDLANELGRDKRTLVSFMEKPNATKDKGTRRSISPRDMRKIQDLLQSCAFIYIYIGSNPTEM